MIDEQRELERRKQRAAEELSALVRAPGWQRLRDEMAKKRSKQQAILLAALEADESAEKIRKQHDFNRGFNAGLETIERIMVDAIGTASRADVEPEPEEPARDEWSAYAQSAED